MLPSKAKEWLDGPYDDQTKQAILALSPEELNDAFSKNLSFGTAGMRGLVGVGTNRLNIYTIRSATQGVVNTLKEHFKEPTRVIIGYDSRLSSFEFAQETARVLIGNGIEALVCQKVMPTPFVSFACREEKCQAAIMITASHNPPEYNGYKVYWNDGSQVVPPIDQAIISQVENIKSFNDVHLGNLDSPLYKKVSESLTEKYLKVISSIQPPSADGDINIVYTPLHGAGISLMPETLDTWGFKNIVYVDEQKEPDGNFPTTKKPNPENIDALSLGIKKLESTKADLLLANDPDADRLGAVILHDGKPRFLTGNEMAILMCHYLLSNNPLPKNAAIVKSIVTTDLLDKIAAHFNVSCIEVLTGFKYIGELMTRWEKTKEHTFILGAEESHGYLFGTYARDKDGIASGCLIAKMVLDAKLKNETLIDRLNAIYNEFGFSTSKLITIESKDTRFLQTLDDLRKNPPKTLASHPLIVIDDYQSSQRQNLQTNELSFLTLPESNVITLHLDQGSKLIIRPSGTEPKLKLYGQGPDQAVLDKALAELANVFK